jgi:hypothetical protein
MTKAINVHTFHTSRERSGPGENLNSFYNRINRGQNAEVIVWKVWKLKDLIKIFLSKSLLLFEFFASQIAARFNF